MVGTVTPHDSDERPTRARSTHAGDAATLGVAALLYLALTLVHTWPLARHLTDRLASDAGDPALNAWILWWNATTTPLTTAWWDGLGFWPTTGTLAFSEHLLGFAWLTSPIIWLGGSPALAYNVAFLSSFVLAAWATHLLVWRLTGRHDAGVVAGLAVAFATVRAGHLSHLQVLMVGWMPLALLGLHEFWRTRRPVWLALFAVSWLLQALSNNYYALFFSVLVTLWLAWFGLRRGAWGRLAAASAASILAASLLLPLARGYRAVHDANGLQRGLDEVAIFSADLAAFANAAPALRLWGWLRTEDRGERELFGGLTAVTVLAVLAWRRRREQETRPATDATFPEERWRRITRRALTVAGLLVVASGVALALDGRDRHVIAGLEISTRHPEKPVMVGVACLALAAALSARTRRLFQARGTLAFYVAAWIACLILSLGPELRFLETRLLYRMPYGLLFELVPAFDGVRVPARFTMLASLCLAVAAALAFARLTPRGSRAARLGALAVALALFVEGSVRALPLAALPEPAPALPAGDAIVLELPMADVFGEVAALHRSVDHRRRIVNGYSGHEPAFYNGLRDGIELEDVSAFVELTTLTPVTVLIDRRRDQEGRWRRFAEAGGASLVSTTPAFLVLQAPRRGALPPEPALAGAPLAIAHVDSNVYRDEAGAVIDGNLATRWGTNVFQKNGDELIADLGRPAAIAGVAIDQGWWTANVARRLEVAVSDDRHGWRTVWSGTTAVQTMRAALANPREVRLVLPCGDAVGRYVRVRQTDSGAMRSWVVAELQVLGRPAPAPTVTVP